MSESEETCSSPSGYDTFKAEVDNICQQLDILLEENASLDETHRLPVTEFTVNPRRLITLQESLIQSELNVVRDVERERLNKLLQCHFLKNTAWDEMLVKSRSLFCITSDAYVRNYPIPKPDEKSWRKILDVVTNRLQELESTRAKDIPPVEIKRKEGSWKKLSTSDHSRPKVQEALDTLKSSGRETTDSETGGTGRDMELDLDEETYRSLLYPQLELNSRERVEKQLVLIQFMTRKLREAFNRRFDAIHQRKGKVIEEVQRLTKRKRQLKEELAAVKEDQGGNEGELGREGMGLSVGGTGGGSSRSMSDSGRPASALPDAYDDDDYDPRWMPEERPELLLHVEDSEVTAEDDMSESRDGTPSTARIASAIADGDRRSPLTTRSPTAPPSVGSEATWTESRAAFLAGPRIPQRKSNKTPAGPGGRRGKGWTWAEARAWREWRAAQEEELRKRRAHVNTLNLQLERITPSIKGLLQEFDGQVISLIESRVSTDEALLLYQLVSSRLRLRLYHQQDLQEKLVGLQQQRQQVEARLSQVEAEEEGSRREEGRAKGRYDRLQEQLKEEETGLRRAIINLPIDQYNHLLALYTKKATSNVRHLDLPSARSGAPAPLSPRGGVGGGVDLSPATPAHSESGGPGTRRGSFLHSRPPSSTPRSDEQKQDEIRVEDDQMPEGLTGGVRTWRMFQKYRKRRQELLEEAEEASYKRATAMANLQQMDTHRQSLLQQAQKVDDVVSDITNELNRLDDDMELVLLLQSGQVKLDLEEVTQTIEPNFDNTRLVPKEELDDLESTIKKCGVMALEGADDEGVGGAGGDDAEVEALRLLRGQLELQVELAKQDLHHINNFKVSKDIMRAATDVLEGGSKQDSTQLYASLQRLQQLHEDRSKGIASSSHDLDRRVDKTRRRVGSLQQEVEALAQEIDDLQNQVTQAQPEMAAIKRENRLRRVMVCSDLAAQTRQRQAAIVDLEHELETLRLRTFPMLTRPRLNPS